MAETTADSVPVSREATEKAKNDTATPSRKQPPPEKPSDVRRRSYVILSFWLIVLCLGLPIWWKTTTIYRAELPLDEMMEWADGKVRCGSLTQLQSDCADLFCLARHAVPSSLCGSPSKPTSYKNKRHRISYD